MFHLILDIKLWCLYATFFNSVVFYIILNMYVTTVILMQYSNTWLKSMFLYKKFHPYHPSKFFSRQPTIHPLNSCFFFPECQLWRLLSYSLYLLYGYWGLGAMKNKYKPTNVSCIGYIPLTSMVDQFYILGTAIHGEYYSSFNYLVP